MITGGPIDNAIEIEELAHEIKYPNDVATLATKQTIPHATKK